MSASRQPLLADRILAKRIPPNEAYIDPKAMDMMRAGIRRARRFVLDDDAVRRLADVITTIPEMLAQECEFARPPYDTMWIEYPADAFYSALRDNYSGPAFDEDSGDKVVGFLIDHGRVNVFACGMDGRVSPTPLQYRLNTEWPIEDQLRFAAMADCSRMGLDQLLWGEAWKYLDQNAQRALRDRNVMECAPLNVAQHRMTDDLLRNGGLRRIVESSTGEFKVLVAILLMLNRPTVARYSADVPRAHGRIGNRFLPFMSHTTVSISADPVATLRLVGTSAGEGVPKRRHECRGHWCHDKTARAGDCVHAFQPVDAHWTRWPDAHPGEANRFLCSECGGKRWWRDAHMRGSAGVGFVAKDLYAVTS